MMVEVEDLPIEVGERERKREIEQTARNQVSTPVYLEQIKFLPVSSIALSSVCVATAELHHITALVMRYW